MFTRQRHYRTNRIVLITAVYLVPVMVRCVAYHNRGNRNFHNTHNKISDRHSSSALHSKLFIIVCIAIIIGATYTNTIYIYILQRVVQGTYSSDCRVMEPQRRENNNYIMSFWTNRYKTLLYLVVKSLNARNPRR